MQKLNAHKVKVMKHEACVFLMRKLPVALFLNTSLISGYRDFGRSVSSLDVTVPFDNASELLFEVCAFYKELPYNLVDCKTFGALAFIFPDFQRN